MYWADTIWRMYFREGKTIPEIVKYFNHPIVTTQYVETLFENIVYLKYPRKKRNIKRYKNSKPPLPGTKGRIIWEFMEERGGPEFLKEQLKNKTLTALANEWGFEWYALRNYKRDFLTGRAPTPKYIDKVNRLRCRQGKIHTRSKKLKTLW